MTKHRVHEIIKKPIFPQTIIKETKNVNRIKVAYISMIT